MPYYDFECAACGKSGEEYIPMVDATYEMGCECGGTKRMVFRQPPAAHGLSDGPGSHVNKGILDRPDPLKECRLTAKVLEDAGRLKDPVKRELVDIKLRALEAQEPTRTKLDYQKKGGEAHPLYGVDRR